LAFHALHADRAAVGFDDGAGDVEAEAQAAVVAAGDVAGAVEALEELGDLVLGMPMPWSLTEVSMSLTDVKIGGQTKTTLGDAA
jgi:hypothetical protein